MPHGALRDFHLTCDLRRLEAVDAAQQERATAFWGKPIERALDDGDFLLAHERALRGGRFTKLLEQRRLAQLLATIAAAHAVNRDVRGGLEQKRSQETHCVRLIQIEHSHVGFLRNFERFLARAQPRSQESHQTLVMLAEQTGDELCARLFLPGVSLGSLLSLWCYVGKFVHILVAIRYSRGLDGLDVRAPKSGKKISLARLVRWIVLPAIRSNTCSHGDDNNMNYEAGFRMKNLSSSRALRAAVRSACLQGVLAASLLTGTLAHGADVQPAVAISVGAPIAFDIPAQSLETALLRFSEQARIQVVVANGAARGAVASQVKGEYSAGEALQLLLKESGLAYEVTGERTIAIRGDAKGAKFERTSLSTDSPIGRVDSAQAVVRLSAAADSAGPTEAEKAASQNQNRAGVEEVIVTGTFIRGAQNLSAPVISIGRDQIERSGYSTVGEVIASLPQNVSSVSDRQGTVNSVGDNNYLVNGFGAGANLRGLGVDSTLVLLNGRRMARAGGDSFVDLTMIPLSAIERVEVLTDGASALYGADAVGGVINLITRQDVEGGETRLRYGDASHSARFEKQATQMIGHSWTSGQFFAAYDYLKTTPLAASERFENLGGYLNVDLIPGSVRRSAMLSVEQSLAQNLRVHMDLTHGERVSPAGFRTNRLGFARFEGDSSNTGVAAGLSWDLGSDWQLRADASTDKNALDLTWWTGPTLDSLQHVYDNTIESKIKVLSVVADGPVAHIAGGSVRLAVGAEGRWDELTRRFNNSDQTSNLFHADRHVTAAYAELTAPLVGKGNRRTGLERLEFTLAGRYEQYSDFGSSFNPKLGISWAPLEGLNLRGSAGTSFKAPTLSQTSDGLQTYTFLDYYLDANGPTDTLVLLGSATELTAEESKNWSFGFDYRPARQSNLSLAATYFSIEYDNRIGSPFPNGYSEDVVILDPTYDFLVGRSPTIQDIEKYLNASISADCYDMGTDELCDPYAAAPRVQYIVDTRTRNLASVRQRGVDFMIDYQRDTPIGLLGLQGAGMKMLKSTKQFVPGGIDVDQLNQVWYPVDFRARGSMTLARNGWAITATVNYVDSYQDTNIRLVGSAPRRSKVASFTTADLSLQQDLNRLLKIPGIGELALQLSAINLFDRDPPFVSNSVGLNYDPVNGEALGRFVSVQLRASW